MRNEITVFNRYEYHKGFYNDSNPEKALFDINYTDFFDLPDDEDFFYSSAHDLLCGSCEIFALSLKKFFGYNTYIIEESNNIGFHVFCQIYKDRELYYVDARGITTSFDEFMDVAKQFIHKEYIIRQVNPKDIKEWQTDALYSKEGYAFAEAIIKKYKECYTLE